MILNLTPTLALAFKGSQHIEITINPEDDHNLKLNPQRSGHIEPTATKSQDGS